MSPRSLREELRDVFDDLSEPAHPALSARIRDRIASAGPTPRTPRSAVALAAAVAALAVVGLVLIGHHAVAPTTTPAGRPAHTPAVVSPPPTAVTGEPAPTPGTAITPSPAQSLPTSNLPAFSCTAQSGGGAVPAPPVGVTSVRAASQTGYDRFVIELNGAVPQYEVKPQSGAVFVQDPSGAPVTLSGSAGLVVTLHGAQSHGTYTGQTDLHPSGTMVVKEARQIGDFEGVVTWGLGLSHSACFRVFTLTGPSRLVVDVQG